MAFDLVQGGAYRHQRPESPLNHQSRRGRPAAAANPAAIVVGGRPGEDHLQTRRIGFVLHIAQRRPDLFQLGGQGRRRRTHRREGQVRPRSDDDHGGGRAEEGRQRPGDAGGKQAVQERVEQHRRVRAGDDGGEELVEQGGGVGVAGDLAEEPFVEKSQVGLAGASVDLREQDPRLLAHELRPGGPVLPLVEEGQQQLLALGRVVPCQQQGFQLVGAARLAAADRSASTGAISDHAAGWRRRSPSRSPSFPTGTEPSSRVRPRLSYATASWKPRGRSTRRVWSASRLCRSGGKPEASSRSTRTGAPAVVRRLLPLRHELKDPYMAFAQQQPAPCRPGSFPASGCSWAFSASSSAGTSSSARTKPASLK